MRRAISVLLLLAAVAACARSARATDLHQVITDISTTSWSSKDGLPAARIWALAQDADGYLWIGTNDGVVRFDGLQFVRWEIFGRDPLPSRFIRVLRATRDGSIWVGFSPNIGYATEGPAYVARLQNGRATVYSERDGLGLGTVRAIVEDGSGAIWVGTQLGLFQFAQDRWTQWGSSRGVPEGTVVAAYVDRDENLYVAHSSGILKRVPHGQQFQRVADFQDTLGGFSQASDGTMWVTDPTFGYRPLATPAGSLTTPRRGRGSRILTDQRGNLWVGTGGQGVWRVKTPSPATANSSAYERSIAATGLLGEGVTALFDDKDGNIWVGTLEGLTRLTARNFDQIVDLGLVRGVVTAAAGPIWVGSVGELFKFGPGPERSRQESIRSDLRAMTTDERGGIWMATDATLHGFGPNGQHAIFPWGARASSDHIESITSDGAGGLWVTSSAPAVYRWRAGHLVPFASPDLPRARVTAAFTDSRRRAWMAFDAGHLIAVTADGAMQTFPPNKDGRLVYRTIFEDANATIWLGGEGGLTRWRNEQFATLSASERFPIRSITAIVSDQDGTLWLGTSAGIVRIEPSEFEGAVADPSFVPRYRVYTRLDGVAGTPSKDGLFPRAARGQDGRLWFTTSRGITMFDPRDFQNSNHPVSVHFQSAVADDRRLLPGAAMELPAGTRKVEINYTAVDITSPLKYRFRYRLDPFDSDWVDAGNRRQAFYTNLRPGPYQFQLAVSEVDGGNFHSETMWDFSVAPRFYQTQTFIVLCAASVGLILFMSWRLRERHLRNQFGMLLGERTRLSREIHDTLLQGLVGLTLQFEVMAQELETTAPQLHGQFVRLRSRTEQYIREARRAILDLRSPASPRDRLVDELRQVGEDATSGRGLELKFNVVGTPRPCDARVEEQLLRIGTEAVLNSARHADAKHLNIELVYGDSDVTLRVTDDGHGFNTDVPPPRGHYGLISMSERAAAIGGSVRINSRSGGTEVVVGLPTAV